jgi:hypothetical protein
MRILLVLFFAFNCLITFGQIVNLGTTYFRNDQYLISFDKVLYPGYNLRIENLRKREYLIGQLVQDSVYKGSWDVGHEQNDNSYNYNLELNSDVYSFPCINLYQEDCLFIYGTLIISGSKVANEKYEIPDNFQFYTSSTAPIKRMNKEASKVEVVSIESSIDFETNQIIQSETVLETRNLSSKEVADSEGNIYLTTTIGYQTWMAENLRSTKFSNGVEIPMLTEAQWANSTAPGIVSINPEGTFYNFYTLASENNVCPQGFHVPNNQDIAELYNTITPYNEYLKVSGSRVKKKVYSPVLAPIVIPALSAVHLGMWGGVAAFDAGLISVAAITDLALFSSELAVSPFFGWRTKKSQNKANLKMAKKYTYINVKGIPVSYDNEENYYSLTNLNPINKSDWSNFKVVNTEASDQEEAEGEIITNQQTIDSLKKNHVDYKYKLKFKPFCIPGTDTFWSSTAWLVENFEGGGFGSFNIMPYKLISDKDYPFNNYRCSLGKFGHQPVLTLLLNKGNNEFADQYGFNLNFDNTISFAKKLKSKVWIRTGISYLDSFGLPGFFGIAGKSDAHELNLLENFWDQRDISEADLMRMQTRVRCLKD